MTDRDLDKDFDHNPWPAFDQMGGRFDEVKITIAYYRRARLCHALCNGMTNDQVLDLLGDPDDEDRCETPLKALLERLDRAEKNVSYKQEMFDGRVARVMQLTDQLREQGLAMAALKQKLERCAEVMQANDPGSYAAIFGGEEVEVPV